METKIDGKLYEIVEGEPRILLCGDCRTPMPLYRDASSGYISPESSEFRLVGVDGHTGIEALEKPVCVPCYLAAFKRVYPKEKLPKVSAE